MERQGFRKTEHRCPKTHWLSLAEGRQVQPTGSARCPEGPAEGPDMSV